MNFYTNSPDIRCRYSIFKRLCITIVAVQLLSCLGCFQSANAVADDKPLRNLVPLCIPITSEQQADYRYFDTFEDEGKVYLVGNNESSASLDLFSVTDQAYVKSIPYNSTGPDAVTNVLGLKMITPNLLWIVSSNHFYSFNLQNEKVINSFSFSELDTRLIWNQYTYFFDNHGRVVALNDSTILLRAANPPLYERNSLLHVVSLNVKTRQIKELPIKLPKWLNENNHFAGLNTLHYGYDGDRIYYNYPFSDSLYQYDLASGKLLEPTQLNSPLLPSIVKPYQGGADISAIVEYSSNSDYYMGFQHLESSPDVLYRFAIKTRQDPETDYTTFIEFFQQGQLIASQEICTNCKTRTFSIANQVYLFKAGEDENQLCFEVLELGSVTY